MSKKLFLLIVLLLIGTVILTACGSKKSDKNENKIALPQTFTSTSGVTLKYPDGWVARDNTDSGNIEVGNSQQSLDSAKYGLKSTLSTGNFAMQLNLSPLPGDLTGQPITEVLKGLVASLNSSDVKMGDIKAVKVAGKEAARVDFSNETNKTETTLFLVKWDTTNFLAFAGMAYQGELSQYDATIQQIAANITYQAPPTPTPAPVVTEAPTFTPAPTQAPNPLPTATPAS